MGCVNWRHGGSKLRRPAGGNDERSETIGRAAHGDGTTEWLTVEWPSGGGVAMARRGSAPAR
jgi:hypothetical protein